MDNFLANAKKNFLSYKLLGEKAINQLEAHQLSIQHNKNTNSIAVIMKHMAGNMLSRWTDLLTSDGEKPWRKRDTEFIEENLGKEILMHKWEEGWMCLFNALDSLTDKDLSKVIFIRKEPLTVMDAITRQLTHYSYHIGQIVFYARQLKQGEWESLSIPRKKV